MNNIMQRKIEFRGKDKDNNWVTGDLISMN